MKLTGENHPNWRGGIKPTYYRRVAFAAHGEACQRCGAGEDLHVHHKDENRRHNDPDNLEVLCRTCHMQEHHGRRVQWECPHCGITLSLQPYLARDRKFCSHECRLSHSRTHGGTFGTLRRSLREKETTHDR